MAAKRPQSRKPVERDAKGRVTGGGSLNPGGLPKWVKDVRDALGEGSVEAAQYVRSVVADAGEATKDRLLAAKIVLEFSMPKPKQEIDVTTSGPGPLFGMTPAQLLAASKGAK